MALSIAVAGIALLFGLAFGSFLNVCIVRLPRNESIVSPPSRCVSCGAPIGWRQNIPLLSYVLLRGRCRSCGAAISAQYPLVELATGVWFVLSSIPFLRLLQTDAGADALLASGVHAAAMAALGFLLIGLLVMDWRTHLLPNEFTLGGLAVGIFFTFAESFFVPPVATKTLFAPEEVFIAHRLLAAVAGWLLLWVIATIYRLLRHRDGMGRGDAKLLAMLGSFLGLGGLGVAFFVGVALAGVAAIVVLLLRRGNRYTHLPFGSFLAIGGLVAAFAGNALAAWYTGLFR